MKIEMDNERSVYHARKEEPKPSRPKKEQSKPSGFKWVLIIALGVFIGNTISFGFEKAAQYLNLSGQTVANTTSSVQPSQKITPLTKLQEIKAKEQQKQNNSQ